jgi:hypothetical protein
MRHEVDWPADDFGQLVGQRLDVPPEPGSRLKLVEQVDVTGGPGITSARWAGEGAARPRARRRPHNPVLPSGPRARVHPPVQRWSDKLVEQRPHTRPRPRGQVSVAATLHRTDHEAPQSRASAGAHPPLRCTPNVPPGGTGCGAQGVPRSRGGRLAGGGFVVTPPDDDERMEPVGCIQLWGRGQRYVLTELLFDHGPLRVAEILALLHAEGLVVGGRPSKTVSDALRWEVAHGRVVRLGRGLYGPGHLPRSTRAWIRRRNRLLRSQRPCPLGHPAVHPPLEDAHHTQLPDPAASSPAVSAAVNPATDAPTHTMAPGPPATRAVAPAPVPHPAEAGQPRDHRHDDRNHPRRGTDSDEVAVLGAGWNEHDEAAEDARLRKQLLAQLGWTGP